MGASLLIENPPIVQLMLTVKFASPIGIVNVLDVADFAAHFRDRYPVYSQVDRAGPMPTDPRSVEVVVSAGPIPRVQLNSEDLQTGILFQEDRLSVFWNRPTALEAAPSYPSFEAIVDTLRKEIANLRQWVVGRNLPDISPAVGEVAYQNAFRVMIDGERRRVSEVLTFFNNPTGNLMLNFLNQWTEPLHTADLPMTEDRQLRGQLFVIGQPGFQPNGEQAIMLSITANSIVEGNSWDSLDSAFEHMHMRTGEAFRASVTRGAVARP